MKRERINPWKTDYLLHADHIHTLLEDYPDELRHQITDAVFRYMTWGDLPENPMIRYSLFAQMKNNIDENNAKYEEKCRKRSEINRANGLKGGAEIGNQNARKYPIKTSETTENKQKQAKYTETTKNGTDTDTVSDYTIINSNNSVCIEKSHTLDKYDELISSTSDDSYRKFLQWIKDNTPFVASELLPPTEKHYQQLLGKFKGKGGKDKMIELLNEMEGKTDFGKNKYVHTTLLNFLKYDKGLCQ